MVITMSDLLHIMFSIVIFLWLKYLLQYNLFKYAENIVAQSAFYFEPDQTRPTQSWLGRLTGFLSVK